MPYYQCMVLQIKNILHKMNNSIFGDNILMLKEYQITIELCFKLHTNMYSTNDFHSYQSLKHCKILNCIPDRPQQQCNEAQL